MRGLLAVSALIGFPVIHRSLHRTHPEACYVAAIAVIVDDVKDVRDIKYHRMVVAGIRKLEPSPDASEESCEPRDGTVPMVLRQAAESRFRGVMIKPPQIQVTYTIRQSSLEGARREIKRFALAARQYAGSFSRVEMVPVDTREAPSSAELALPTLAISDADAASCTAENKTLERSGAKYRWAC
jgi:hypothetical protein